MTTQQVTGIDSEAATAFLADAPNATSAELVRVIDRMNRMLLGHERPVFAGRRVTTATLAHVRDALVATLAARGDDQRPGAGGYCDQCRSTSCEHVKRWLLSR